MSQEDVKEPKKDPGATEHINIKVKSGEGNEVFFKVKPNTKFHKIFEAFCDRMGRSMKDVRFFSPEGERIQAESTPAEAEIEDGDQIEARIEQVGGNMATN
ncbi:hypothetical protein MP228_010156 [Amoeboaphelidium protococcarum]|nr:hypothetical protein MP228_010156 [Amoeboaphelidium protococcarum]